LRPRTGASAIAVALLALAALAADASAQITIDGTLSPARALTGPNFSITAALGRQLGANLFQSFGQFNLAAGENATFSGPSSVQNVIARVTGGNASSIDGTIASTIPGANLFLINPAGIMFGPSAALNVQGSFHATTADYLRLSDGAIFSATTPSGSSLSVAAPQAFGFLSSNPAVLAVTGSTLAVPAGNQLSIIGAAGGVNISGAALSAPSGRLYVASVAAAGEIGVDPSDSASLTATSFGPIQLTNAASLDTSGSPAGSVDIRGGVVNIDDSTVTSNHSGAGTGGGIMLSGDALTLSDGARVEVADEGSGSSGDIFIDSGNIALSGQSVVLTKSDVGTSGASGSVAIGATGNLSLTDATIASETFGSGNAGAVSVMAGSIAIDDSVLVSDSLGLAHGNAGPVTVTSGPLTVTAGGQISSNTSSFGNAGAVTVAAQELSLTAGGTISSATIGPGNAGAITVTSTGAVSIDGSLAPELFTGISAESNPGASGNAGTISVTGSQISLLGGGEISSATFGVGLAGAITINTAGTLSIDGTAATVPTEISSSSESITGNGGAAGSVTIMANDVLISATGLIVGLTSSGGNAGDITLTASGLTITGDNSGLATGILTDSLSTSTGNAGTVTIRVGDITLAAGGQIDSITSGSGKAGAVTVVAGSILADGGESGISSNAEVGSTGNAGLVSVSASSLDVANGANITSNNHGSGDGGDVTVTVVGDALVAGGGQIGARTTGAGTAGTVTISAQDLTLDNAGTIATSAASGGGGDIVIHASDLVNLDFSSITTSVAGGIGNGGNITIDPPAVVLDQSSIIAQAVAGNGGNILISASVLIQSPDSLISASSQLGISGTITIAAPSTDVTASLAELSGKIAAPPRIAREGCVSLARLEDASRLVVAGQGGLPPDATQPLSLGYFGGDAGASATPAISRETLAQNVASDATTSCQ
jgi:filamentous hemagglutinin family protein